MYATRSAVEWSKSSPARSHALRVMAATASVGRDSIASHQSAALIHGLDLFPRAPDLVTLTRPPLRSSGRRKSDGIFFHTAELPASHVTRQFGARVTSVPRTVVDLARVSSFMSAVVTVDSALREGLTTTGALVAVCDACAGWPGIRQARRVVDFGDPGAESVLESCARVVFDEQGLDAPQLQFAVTGPDFRYSVDFYWPRHRVIAEADGAIKYSDQPQGLRIPHPGLSRRDGGATTISGRSAGWFAQRAMVRAARDGLRAQRASGGVGSSPHSERRGRHREDGEAVEQGKPRTSATAPPLSLRRRGHCVASKSKRTGAPRGAAPPHTVTIQGCGYPNKSGSSG